jgi:hypothetical protein
MKKFDLNTIKISILSSDEINELKLYLKTVSVRVCANFILHVMDIEYTLSEYSVEIQKVEKFMSDKQFEPIREVIMRISDGDITESEWIQIERQHKVKQRKEKLFKLTENEKM